MFYLQVEARVPEDIWVQKDLVKKGKGGEAKACQHSRKAQEITMINSV